MFLGLGVGDSGLTAELNHKSFYLTHEIQVFKDEQYISDGLGYELQQKIMSHVKLVERAKVSYEHHYQSVMYARGYVTATPEIGIRSTHDYIGLQLMWQPFKYFYRTTKQEAYPLQGIRFNPAIVLSIRFDLQYTIYVPKELRPQQQQKLKSIKKGVSK